MTRILVAIFLFLATPVVAQDPTFGFSADDPAMNAAIAEARDTLPAFLDTMIGANGSTVEGVMLKVAVPTVNGVNAHEHIWVAPVKRQADGSFVGTLANEPVELGDLRLGDDIPFSQDQISDWSLFSPEGLLYGNYTSRVMYDQGAFGAVPFEMIFTPDPIPPGLK
ncbi:MAG: DUF2314 domain-containing protein [Tabrizicola sp.]|nr:DUF2314 domain-containing protein [Tabrizicola sp.]